MDFFDFLSTHSKVESIIGLLSFIVSAFLGFLIYRDSLKMKGIANIIKLADNKNKANLATALLEVIPSYQIPDLNEEQGFKIIKMQMKQKEKEFNVKMQMLKLGILLFTLIIVGILISSYFKFKEEKQKAEIEAETHGSESPIIIGPGATVNYTTTDTTKVDSLNQEK